jgi:hypothetical protein
MTYPSYSYTLTNGSTADASKVQQNLNDVLNGISDGTKDNYVNSMAVNNGASFKQISEPASPSSNYSRLWPNSSGDWFSKDSAGNIKSFKLAGTIVTKITSGTYTILDDDSYENFFVSASGDSLTLPDAANNIGRTITIIKNYSGNTANQIICYTAQKIYNGADEASTIYQDFHGEMISLICVNSAGWQVKNWSVPTTHYDISGGVSGATSVITAWARFQKTKPISPVWNTVINLNFTKSSTGNDVTLTIANITFAITGDASAYQVSAGGVYTVFAYYSASGGTIRFLNSDSPGGFNWYATVNTLLSSKPSAYVV